MMVTSSQQPQQEQQQQQQDSRSILSQSTVSSMSTNQTTGTGNNNNNNNSMIRILTTTTNSSSHHRTETRRRRRRHGDEDDDRTTMLRHGMDSLQIHPPPHVNCNTGDGTSVATLSTTTTATTTTTTTTTTTRQSEPGSLITIVDDTTSSSSSSSDCPSGTSGDGSTSEAQDPYVDEHGRNTLLHDLILDYSMNVLLTSPHDRAQYEQQIRNVAELNPEWVITYNHNGHTPFHIACQTGNIPLRIIQDLFYTYPSTITTPTQPPLPRRRRRRHRRIHGRTTTDNDHHHHHPPCTTNTNTTIMLPLHLVCRYYSGDLQYQIVQFLLQMYPAAARIWTLQPRPSDDDNRATTRLRTSVNDDDDNNDSDGMRRHDLAIHLYCQNHHCQLAVLQELLIPAHPESIRRKSVRTGQLPIHLACERQYFTRVYHRKYDPKPTKTTLSSSGGGGGSHTNVSDAVIQYFLTLYPESVTIRDESRGEVPFLTAIRGHQSVSTLQLLSLQSSDDSMATVVDAQGRTALHRYCITLANNRHVVNNLGLCNDHSHPPTVDCVRGDDPILQLLLQLDSQNMAGTIVDQAGRRPLHYLLLQQPDKRCSVSLDVLYALIRSDPTFLELGRTARATPTTTTTTTTADD